MLKKIWPKDGVFSIPLIREITLILIIKVIVIFTIKHVYFSNPVPFDADHIFGEVQTSSSFNYNVDSTSNTDKNSILNTNVASEYSIIEE